MRHACVDGTSRRCDCQTRPQAQLTEHLGAGGGRAPAAPSRDARGHSAPADARRGSGTAANGTAGRSAATVRTRRRGPRLPKGASSSSRPATSEKHSVRFELQLRVLCRETQHERRAGWHRLDRLQDALVREHLFCRNPSSSKLFMRQRREPATKAFESRLTLKVRIRCTSAARSHELDLAALERLHVFSELIC